MAKLTATNLTISAIKTAVGSALNNLSGLVTLTNLNPYSFYSPGGPRPNASTKIIEYAPVTSGPYKQGDFRYYDHVATAGTSGGNFSIDVYEDGPDPRTIEFNCEFRELNYKRLDSGISRIRAQLYDDAGHTSPIGSLVALAITEDTESPSPPTGHVVTQTKIIEAGVHNWPQASLSSPWSYSTLYAIVELGDSSTAIARTTDYSVTITCNKIYKPSAQRGNITGDLGGKSASDVFMYFTDTDGGRLMSDNTTNLNFDILLTWYQPGPNFYGIYCDFDVYYRKNYGDSPTYLGSYTTAASTGEWHVNTALPGGAKVYYDDDYYIDVDITTWNSTTYPTTITYDSAHWKTDTKDFA